MRATLDATDRRILEQLQRDSRVSNREIARGLGLSEGAVRKRVDRLVSNGTLQFFAAVDPVRLGLEASVVVGVQAELAKVQSVAGQLAGCEEVGYLAYCSGDFDLLAVVLLPSEAHLFGFLFERLATIEGIRRTVVLHVLKVAKRTLAWGLPSPSPTLSPRPAPAPSPAPSPSPSLGSE